LNAELTRRGHSAPRRKPAITFISKAAKQRTGLPPGKYNCQVTALDPKAQKAAFWQAPVMLVE